MKAVEIPLPSHARGTEVALAQRQALIRQLEPLEPHQWQLVTECAPWTVRDIAAHIAGTLSYTRNPLAYAGLVTGWLLHFRGRNFVDGTNEAAIRTYRRLSTDQLLEVLRRDTPRAVPPGWSRPLPLMGVASLPKYAPFGHLADVVLPAIASCTATTSAARRGWTYPATPPMPTSSPRWCETWGWLGRAPRSFCG